MSRRTGLTVLTALSMAATLVFGAAQTAPAAETKTKWQVLPGVTHNGVQPLLAFGWASNRVWIVTVPRDVPTLVSAHVSGSRLTGLVKTRIPAELTLISIVDGQLVFDRGNGDSRKVMTAPLLANGQLGATQVVSDELLARGKEVAPKLAGVSILAGAGAGGRTVWALSGGEEARGIGGAPQFFLACCSESGAAVDLTRFIERRTGVDFARIGRDTRGRIWLAWLDRRDYSGAQRGYPRIIELDRSTLAPRSKAAAIPGVVADNFALACAVSCRVVAQSAAGDLVSWAPGERSPTRVVSHTRSGVYTYPAVLLAAAYRSGRLVVAYHDAKYTRSAPGGEITRRPRRRTRHARTGHRDDRRDTWMAAREALSVDPRPGRRRAVRAERPRRDRVVPNGQRSPTGHRRIRPPGPLKHGSG